MVREKIIVFFAALSCLFSSANLLAQEISIGTPSDVEIFPDNTYDEIADRISCIQGEVPLNFNEKVKAFVDYFSIKNREYTQNIIEKKELYFPIFSETLAKYDMPDELKYLAIVESGLRPNAISRANAVGLWQFISSDPRHLLLKSHLVCGNSFRLLGSSTDYMATGTWMIGWILMKPQMQLAGICRTSTTCLIAGSLRLRPTIVDQAMCDVLLDAVATRRNFGRFTDTYQERQDPMCLSTWQLPTFSII